jgi:hypothetical protein
VPLAPVLPTLVAAVIPMVAVTKAPAHLRVAPQRLFQTPPRVLPAPVALAVPASIPSPATAVTGERDIRAEDEHQRERQKEQTAHRGLR